MRIDDLQVALRPRQGWEAAELGMALVRRHAAVVWPVWLALVLPVAVLLNTLLWQTDQLWLAGLLLWWLKPVFERSVLYVISRGVFGQQVSVGQALRAQWGFAAAPLAAHLLWRRLSPARSLLMPVDMLEGGSAALRRQRRHSLLGSEFGMAALVTWLMLHFELVLVVGLMALGAMMVPLEMLGDTARAIWENLRQGQDRSAMLVFNGLSLLAMSVIGPLYVGAGFGIYLDARTRREAWDVELGLRRLGERLRARAPRRSGLVLSGLLTALLWLPASPPAQAQAAPVPAQPTATTPPPPAAQWSRAVEQAYHHDALGKQRTLTRWRWGEPKQKNTATLASPPQMPSWLRMIVELLAMLSSGLLWVLVAALVLALLLTARRWLPWLPWLRGGASKHQPAAVEHSALSLPEGLPRDVAGQAAQLWAQGRGRQALALLYRASVEAMSRLSGQQLPAGATEAYCLRAASALPQGEQRSLFAAVVSAWQQAAYAGRLPDDQRFEHLLAQMRQQPGWLP